jgi:death-on-curing protein
MGAISEPKWLTYDQVIAMHARQLRRFGGAPGLRDEGMLRSALDRPVNKWNYEAAELSELAAAHGYGLAKNHAFVDGNKRIAFISMVVFLRKNGITFSPDPAHSIAIMLAVAGGEIDEESLARWIRDNWPKP